MKQYFALYLFKALVTGRSHQTNGVELLRLEMEWVQ